MHTRNPLTSLKVITVVGPTASGKSELGVELAKIFNGVIISADSRQIYRGMDIGTTKITKEEMQGVPHYMLNIVDPDDDFNVSAFQKSVMNLLKSIARKNLRTKSPTIPIIVGGTGLYVSAIVDGYEFTNIKPNLSLRQKLNEKNIDELVKILKKLDSNALVDTNNKRRVIRAIEILQEGGKPPTKNHPPFEVLKLGLGNNRQKALKRMQVRIYGLDIKKLVTETKKLIRKKYKFNLPALSALGYADVKAYIDKKIDEKELKDRLFKLHRQYAKRQMTWFKRDKEIKWVKNLDEAEKLVSQFLFD